MAEQQQDCVARSTAPAGAAAEVARCVDDVCSVVAALQGSQCSLQTNLTILSSAESTCAQSLAVSSNSSGLTVINATTNTTDSTLYRLTSLMERVIYQCDVSGGSFAMVGSCYSRLQCRAGYSTLCTPLCLAQTLTCILTYSCGQYIPLEMFTQSPELQVADLVPLDVFYCAAVANVTSSTLWNETTWIQDAMRLLSQASAGKSGTSKTALEQAYIIGPASLALVLLVVGSSVVVYNCMRKRCARRQLEVTARGGDEPQLHYVRSSNRDTIDDDPPTSIVVATTTTTEPSQRRVSSKQAPPPAAAAAWHGGKWVEPEFHESEGEDNETELFRPKSQYITSKPADTDQWRLGGDMLFVDEDDDLRRHHTRGPSGDDRFSSSAATSGDGYRARVELPQYAGATARHPRSQTSLAELEFAFTDPSRTNGSNSQHNDDVIRLQPMGVDDDGSATSDGGNRLTPMSNSDTDEQRLVFDQESLRSSTNSQNQHDMVVAAGSVMARRDILHFILQGMFVRGRLLGRGTHGAVYQMNLSVPDQQPSAVDASISTVSVAMKEIDVQHCTREELSKIIARFNFLSRLSHRHIVELYVVRYESSTLSLNVWMEFLGGGTLSQLAKTFINLPQPNPPGSATPPGGDDALLEDPIATLKHRPGQMSSRSSLSGAPPTAARHEVPTVFPERDVVRFVPQLLSALSYLHRKGVIHRDVKGSNVLLSLDHRSAKLADLDVCFIAVLHQQKDSATSAADHPHHSVAGSPLWMPPEILSSRCGPTASTDIWSLGITIAELLMGGALPWPRFDTTFSAMMYITHPNHAPVLRRADVSESCLEFLSMCWNPTAEFRPSAMELRSHPWFQQSRPSSFRRMPSQLGGGATKSVTNTNNSGRSYESSLVWEEPGEGAPALEERQDLLKKRFDDSAMEAEMKRLDDELSLM